MAKSITDAKTSVKVDKKSATKDKKSKKEAKSSAKSETPSKDAIPNDTNKPAPTFVFGAPVAVTDALIADKYSSADAEAIRKKQAAKRLIAEEARAKASVADEKSVAGANGAQADGSDDVADGSNAAIKKSSKSDRERTQRTVFVGNLSVKTKSKAVEKLFKPFGKIETLRFRSIGLSALETKKDETVSRAQAMKTRNKQQGGAESSVNAYVVFSTVEEARAAVQETGGRMDIGGRHLRIDMAGDSKRHDNQHSVFVGNLPYTIADEDLRQYFADCGDVKSVRVIRDPLTSIGKGFGYVHFASTGDVATALQMDGMPLQSRAVRVVRAGEKQQGPQKKPNAAKAAYLRGASSKKGVNKPLAAGKLPVTPTAAGVKKGSKKRDDQGKKKRHRDRAEDPSTASENTSGDTPKRRRKDSLGGDAKAKRTENGTIRIVRGGKNSDVADGVTSWQGLESKPGVIPSWVSKASDSKKKGPTGGLSKKKTKEAKTKAAKLKEKKRSTSTKKATRTKASIY